MEVERGEDISSWYLRQLIEKPLSESTSRGEDAFGIGITGKVVASFPAASIFWVEKTEDGYDLTYSFANTPLVRTEFNEQESLDAITIRAKIDLELTDEVPECTVERNRAKALKLFSQKEVGQHLSDESFEYAPLFASIEELADKIAQRRYVSGNFSEAKRRAVNMRQWRTYAAGGHRGGNIKYEIQRYVAEIIAKKMERGGYSAIYNCIPKLPPKTVEELRPNIARFMHNDPLVDRDYVERRLKGLNNDYNLTTGKDLADDDASSYELLLGPAYSLTAPFVNLTILNSLAEGTPSPYSDVELSEIVQRANRDARKHDLEMKPKRGRSQNSQKEKNEATARAIQDMLQRLPQIHL